MWASPDGPDECHTSDTVNTWTMWAASPMRVKRVQRYSTYISVHIHCKLFVFMFFTLFLHCEHPARVDMCALQIFIIIIIIIYYYKFAGNVEWVHTHSVHPLAHCLSDK